MQIVRPCGRIATCLRMGSSHSAYSFIRRGSVMAKAEINAGICGMHTTVIAEGNGDGRIHLAVVGPLL